MAVNELPIERKTFKADATLLPYSKVANGSPLAGTDRSMTLQTDGELRPAGNGAFVVGKLEILMQSLQASVTTIGQDLGFKQGAVGACVVGMGIVGDTGPDVNGTTGYVRAPAQTDDATGRTERSRSRGIVTEVVSNTAGGEVRVTFP